MKKTFIILHFGLLSPTIDCVHSICSMDYKKDNMYVVIVSVQDKNCEKLKDMFPDMNIYILHINDNLGYARANNYAYAYLKKSGIECDYVIVANNDVVFKQKSFLKLLDTIYKREKFYILGPDIILPKTSTHQNPISLQPPSMQEIDRAIVKYEKALQNFEWFYCKNFLINYLKDISDKMHLTLSYRKACNLLFKREMVDYRKKIEGCLLLGACIIFSKDYLEESEELFNNDTFLYYEEAFLVERCLRNQWKVLFSPDLCVDHNHSIATTYICKSNKEKVRFQTEECLKSAMKYRKYLEEQ